MLTTHPLLVPRLRKSRGYTSGHPDAPLWSVTGPLYLFNITSIVALCFGSENWIMKKRDAPKLEAAQVTFLRPLQDPDCQRTSGDLKEQVLRPNPCLCSWTRICGVGSNAAEAPKRHYTFIVQRNTTQGVSHKHCRRLLVLNAFVTAPVTSQVSYSALTSCWDGEGSLGGVGGGWRSHVARQQYYSCNFSTL
jgi:hypothetical protein